MKNTRRVTDTHRPVNKINFELQPMASLIFPKIEYSLDGEERIEHSQAKLPVFCSPQVGPTLQWKHKNII